MDKWLESHLACPRDHTGLRVRGRDLVCGCDHSYPYVDEIPVLLVPEAAPTHGACSDSLETTLRGKEMGGVRKGNTGTPGSVDPYVQRAVAGTCGQMYVPLINKLNRYPIPQLPFSNGNERTFLDIGCNWGRWCVSAAREGFQVIGIDPSLEAVQAAARVAKQHNIPGHFVVGDARFLPFREGTFDRVFSYSVLQHFSRANVATALSAINRIMRRGGSCWIQMPNRVGLRNTYSQLRKLGRKSEIFDVRYWSLSELRETFEEHIGPVAFHVDGFFGLGIQKSDIDLLPLRYRSLVALSERLRRLSESVNWLKSVADSVYVCATKGSPSRAG